MVQVQNSTLGVRIPADSPVRELLTSHCLRETMNLWFAHGQSFSSTLPPEDCCSACMKRCIARHECDECATRLKRFEPLRKPVNLSQSSPVKYLSQLLSNLHINEKTPNETPPYDTDSLAEAIIGNLIEFKKLETFREFLKVFSLGDEISKVLLDFVTSNFDNILAENVDKKSLKAVGGVSYDNVTTDDLIDDSDSSESDIILSEHSDEYFDDSDCNE